MRDNPNALRTGGIAIASQAANDVFYASSATQLARLANGTTGQRIRATTSAAPAWASGGIDLLKANNGTDTTATATNVDTYAMASGLTAKDRVLVFWHVEAVTQAVAVPTLYNSTDSVGLGGLKSTGTGFAGDNFAAGNTIGGCTLLQQEQSAATVVQATILAGHTSVNVFGSSVIFTTAWTGAWTLALRHGGVTSGGTFKWTWGVFRINGQ